MTKPRGQGQNPNRAVSEIYSDYSEPLICRDLDDLDALRAARGICKWTAICLSVELAIVALLLARTFL